MPSKRHCSQSVFSTTPTVHPKQQSTQSPTSAIYPQTHNGTETPVDNVSSGITIYQQLAQMDHDSDAVLSGTGTNLKPHCQHSNSRLTQAITSPVKSGLAESLKKQKPSTSQDVQTFCKLCSSVTHIVLLMWQ
jgi:hypothetical protein